MRGVFCARSTGGGVRGHLVRRSRRAGRCPIACTAPPLVRWTERPLPSCPGACVVPPLSPVARYLPSNLPISTCTFCIQQAKWHSLLDGKLQFVKRKRPKKHRRPFIENKRFYFTLQKQCLRRKTALECRRLHIPFTDLRNLCASDYVDFYKRGPSCAKVIPCTHSSTEKASKMAGRTGPRGDYPARM